VSSRQNQGFSVLGRELALNTLSMISAQLANDAIFPLLLRRAGAVARLINPARLQKALAKGEQGRRDRRFL
jgi:hypothetical protein